MIILPLVFVFWMMAHNQADDLCRPTIDGVPTLLCPSHIPLGFPRAAPPPPGPVSPLLIPHWPQEGVDRAFEQRLRGLLWAE